MSTVSEKTTYTLSISAGSREEAEQELASILGTEPLPFSEEKDTTYNGWKNYETWVTALWIDNEEGTYHYSREMVREAYEDAETASQVLDDGIWTRDEAARFTLEDRLKEWVTDELLPEVEGLAGDLLGSAVDGIDFLEIAENYLSALDES